MENIGGQGKGDVTCNTAREHATPTNVHARRQGEFALRLVTATNSNVSTMTGESNESTDIIRWNNNNA